MTFILLVRHGQNDWVSKKRLAGWLPDIHLNAEGHQQAQAAAERLAHLPIRAVYSSPLVRCLETAGYIAQSQALPVLEEPAIGEVRYGEWQGQELAQLAKEPAWYAVQHFPSRFRFPAGESLLESQFRAVQAMEELAAKHPHQMIVLVSHADIIKLLLAHYLGIHIDLFQRIALDPGSVSGLALLDKGMVQVLRVNDTGRWPLPPEPPNPPVEDSKQDA